MADKLLHIYGQGAWHDDVQIVGNKEALEELRDTINKAIRGSSSDSYDMEASVNDGEGYEVQVYLVEGDWDTPAWQRLAVPYTEDYAKEKQEEAIDPWQLAGRKKH